MSAKSKAARAANLRARQIVPDRVPFYVQRGHHPFLTREQSKMMKPVGMILKS